MMTAAATFSCNGCKIKFQVIGISTKNQPKYCPYCGVDSIETYNIILC
jgi:rRNA maturation endonuclease Nob1